MKIAGIIAEYDLFHNGHRAQIDLLRQTYGFDRVVVCLSTSLVQRGAPALLPAPVRAAAALQPGGADLVVALPAPYAAATAQQFAMAGVSLLAAAGCDTLAFGAEMPQTKKIMQAAALLQGQQYRQALQTLLGQKTGQPYAVLRQQAAESIDPALAALLSGPNNNLGVEYCAAILQQGAALTPLALPRVGANHGQQQAVGSICSGTALRGLWAQGGAAGVAPVVPAAALPLYRQAEQQGQDTHPLRWETALLTLLRARAADGEAAFAGVRGVTEGLEYRLWRAVRESSTLEELYNGVKAKRYSHARVRRLCLDAALDFRQGELPPLPPYLQVLAANEQGLALLKNAALPADTSLRRLSVLNEDCRRVAAAEERAEDFAALCRCRPAPMGGALRQKPCLVRGTDADK